jgi:hypothetical protein
VAHFGLADADKVNTLRIEWPSGIVQELHNLAVNQILNLTEPPRLVLKGAGRFAICSWKGMTFEVQASTNLTDWMPIGSVTNLGGPIEFDDLPAPRTLTRFYRVRKL